MLITLPAAPGGGTPGVALPETVPPPPPGRCAGDAAGQRPPERRRLTQLQGVAGGETPLIALNGGRWGGPFVLIRLLCPCVCVRLVAGAVGLGV